MNILLCSGCGDGTWFAWLLAHNGHAVEWICCEPKYSDGLHGLLPPALERITDPSKYDLIVFDTVGLGSIAEHAREFAPIIGDSRLADKLETDRLFGLHAMEEMGIRVPPWEPFDSVDKAIRFVQKTRRRYVFKPCGTNADPSLTYVAKSDEDMARYLTTLAGKMKKDEFVLQEFVTGQEVSTEGYFNGKEWFALNHTLECKKFLAGDLGPNTGSSGCLIWMPRRPDPIYQQGLAKATKWCRTNGYIGPLDLNTIVTEGELYGLEWTARFGYSGTDCMTRLLPMEFGQFLYEVAIGKSPTLGPAKHRFAATIRLSIPPYPNKGLGKSVPVLGMTAHDLDTFYASGLRLREGTEDELETDEKDPLVGCPLAVGDSPEQAFYECEQFINRLNIPDLQWRNDVGRGAIARFNWLQRHGWLREIGEAYAPGRGTHMHTGTLAEPPSLRA